MSVSGPRDCVWVWVCLSACVWCVGGVCVFVCARARACVCVWHTGYGVFQSRPQTMSVQHALYCMSDRVFDAAAYPKTKRIFLWGQIRF